jgi:hypothetical protein
MGEEKAKNVTKKKQAQRLHSEREEGGSTSNRNVEKFLPDYTASHGSTACIIRLLFLYVGHVVAFRHVLLKNCKKRLLILSSLSA